MGYAKEQLDRYVMKVIRKMATVEREEIALICENKKKTSTPSQEMVEKLNLRYKEDQIPRHEP